MRSFIVLLFVLFILVNNGNAQTDISPLITDHGRIWKEHTVRENIIYIEGLLGGIRILAQQIGDSETYKKFYSVSVSKYSLSLDEFYNDAKNTFIPFEEAFVIVNMQLTNENPQKVKQTIEETRERWNKYR